MSNVKILEGLKMVKESVGKIKWPTEAGGVKGAIKDLRKSIDIIFGKLEGVKEPKSSKDISFEWSENFDGESGLSGIEKNEVVKNVTSKFEDLGYFIAVGKVLTYDKGANGIIDEITKIMDLEVMSVDSSGGNNIKGIIVDGDVTKFISAIIEGDEVTIIVGVAGDSDF